ncbi:MAG: sulfatase-like hydrolase/transferase [Cellulophaga sp.]
MKYTFLILILLLSLSSCNSNKKNTTSVEQTPNIVLIVIDDLGYADMSITGLTDDVQTPNIDAIAKKGTRFTNAYATSSICSPSRAGLITGSQQQRWGTHWYGGPGIHDATYKTIPELLKQKEYATGYVGKVHYGSNDYKLDNRSFPLNHGFDYFYGHTSARKHYLNHSDSIESSFLDVKREYKKKGQSLRQQALWENKNKVDTIGFSTELFGLKARQFITKNKLNPFFLQLSFNAVHNFTHQLPKEYLEKKELKGYHDWDPSKEDYYDWYKQGRSPNNPEGRAQYLGQLHFLDKEIGSITQSLKDNNLLENTIIILISDNGGSTPIYANNTPLRGSKYTLYEGGIRVPLIISYPTKYQQKTLSHNLVSAMDILPTLCKETGIAIPSNIDGMDISELLTGTNNAQEHDYLAWNNKAQTALRKGKWKLRTASNKAKANSDYEMVEMEYGDFLYNLEKDPGETTNLAKQYPDTLNILKAIFKNWNTSIDGN